MFNFNNSSTSNGSFVPLVSSTVTGPAYTLPDNIGTNGQVLVSNGTILNWGNGSGSGSGTVLTGGDVVMGSTDQKLTLSAVNSIKLDSGLIYKYKEVSADYTPVKNDYFVNCNAGCSIITLPNLSTTDQGLSYIINKGYVGGVVNVNAFAGDTIDGDSSFSLNNLNEKIQIISNGSEKWLLM
jgi:hypothetical protein